MADLREHLGRRLLVLDGGLGTELSARLLAPSPLELLSERDPERVRAVHAAFLRAGCDLVTTHSFLGLRGDLEPFGLGERAADLGERAARLAREAADAWSTPTHPRFVLGSLGPGRSALDPGEPAFRRRAADHSELAHALRAGGVDGFLIETCRDPRQVEAALEGLAQAGNVLPVLVSIFPAPDRAPTELADWVRHLADRAVDLVALNCTDGPAALAAPLAELARARAGPIGAYPNAGAPRLEAGRARYDLAPADFAAALAPLVEHHGLALVGGCCGTGPTHLEALARALRPGPRGP